MDKKKIYEFAERESRARIRISAECEEDARRDLPECGFDFDLIDVCFEEVSYRDSETPQGWRNLCE